MSNLHPSARDLIDAAKRGEGTLPPEARARVHRSVLRRAMALSAAVATTSTASAVSKAAALMATLSSPVAIPVAGAIAGVALVIAFAVKGGGATHPELGVPPPAAVHVVAGAAHVGPEPSRASETDVPNEPSEPMPAATFAPPSSSIASIAPAPSAPSIGSSASVMPASKAPSTLAPRSHASGTTPTPGPDPFAAPIESQSQPVSAASPGDVPSVTPTGAATSPSSARTITAAADLAGDLDLLRQVHAALQGGRPDVALSLLDHEGKGLDAGPLAEEAQGARVSALCQLGRVAEARAATGRFLATWPTSPLASRLREGCAALGVNSKPGDD